MNMLEFALSYASRGWHVFPLKPNGKTPLTPNGFKAATTDPEQIEAWWKKHPKANIGIACGASGLVVLDGDVKHGADPDASLANLLNGHHTLPATLRAETPSGGWHQVFIAPPDGEVRNSAGQLGPGLDVRAIGGYVVVAPSVVDGKPYRWVSDVAPAVFPECLQGELSQSPFKQATTGLKQGARNDGVFRYASKLRGMGMAENEARELVLEAAACCIPPLDEAEAMRCLESAWRYPAGINLTDTGNGQRLAARYGQDIRYSHALRVWLLWDTRWIFDDAGGIIVLAKDTARGIYIEAAQQTDDARRAATAKHATASESLPRLTAMVELAKSEPGIPIRPDELDRDAMLLGVRNGTVNLLTGGLRTPRREDYITKSAMTHYDPAADCPQWRKFLNRIMAGDPEMIGFLQRAIGYSLTGSTAEQCLFMLYGTGANGKSTFLNVLGELVGDYGANTPAESLMVQHNPGVRNDIARLRGVRFVTAIETEDGQRLAESLVKSLVGGDVISARFLYGEFFDFKPQFKLFLAANHKPIIKGDDYAIWRRVRLVPFEVTVPEAEWDLALPEKLRAELPGILNWAIEGCLEWQRTGLRAPDKVMAATAEYRGEMDFMQQFLDECCHIAPAAAAGATELYKAYQQWAEDNTGWCLSQTKFSLKLMERGFTKEKTPWIRYRGIGLRREDF